MESAQEDNFDYSAAVRTWMERAPWYQRFSRRFGLQGKLVLCFMLLLSVALGASSYLFLNQSSQQLGDLIGEQARQISSALALASKPAMSTQNAPELRSIGQDLLKSRNVLFVAFTDTDNKVVAIASRDPDFKPEGKGAFGGDAQSLMQVRSMQSATLGEYIEVVAPIVQVSVDSVPGKSSSSGSKLLGYVAVGVSPPAIFSADRRLAFVAGS